MSIRWFVTALILHTTMLSEYAAQPAAKVARAHNERRQVTTFRR